MAISTKERISYLLRQYAKGFATREELEELTGIMTYDGNEHLVQEVLSELSYTTTPLTKYGKDSVDRMVDNILAAAPGRVVPIGKGRTFLRMAAAAVVLLALGIGGYFYYSPDKKQEVARAAVSADRFAEDVLPGGDKAVLTLANGKQIILDSASGNVTAEGGVRVINLAGQLSYEAAGPAGAAVYHTVATPRGGQYQLVLADGTKVWLNAASSLRFPTSFPGKERVVELAGEGYFEVAHNRAKPFRVAVNGTEVEVLGTHFNINSYENEGGVRATLLEGSVRVSRPASHDKRDMASRTLQPGEQAVVQEGAIEVHEDVELDAVVAWKNGQFSFRQADIQTIMRQIERWYDVDVAYRGAVNETFFLKMDRHTSVSQVLRVLEATGGVHFEVKDRKITVIP